MNPAYLFVENIATEVDIPKDGILSRTVYADEKVKVIIFGFDTGQELSKHTSSSTALLHIVKGNATLTLGGDVKEVGEGAWAQMAPRLEHAIFAKTPVVMLLYMLQ